MLGNERQEILSRKLTKNNSQSFSKRRQKSQRIQGALYLPETPYGAFAKLVWRNIFHGLVKVRDTERDFEIIISYNEANLNL